MKNMQESAKKQVAASKSAAPVCWLKYATLIRALTLNVFSCKREKSS